MKTNNYDLLVQLDEKILNKALAMVYYKGLLNIDGSYEIIEEVPEDFKGFSTLNYKIRLRSEPFLDFRGTDQVFMRISTYLTLTVLSGIEIKLGLDFFVKTKIQFDLDQRKLMYKINDVEIIKITLNDQIQLGKRFIKKLNEIFTSVLREYFTNEVKEIQIPFALQDIALPYMPEGDAYKLPVSNIDVKILDKKTLVAGVDFFTAKGSLDSATSFTTGREFATAISNETLYKIFDFWWQNTNYPKTQSFNGDTPVNFGKTLSKIADTTTRVLTLGFIQSEREYSNMVLQYGGNINMTEKPEFKFSDDNKVIISKLNASADVYAKITANVSKEVNFDSSSFINDDKTSWEDDIKLSSSNKVKELIDLENTVILNLENVEGELKLNAQNNLAIKVNKADIDIDFKKKSKLFSEEAWDNLIDFLKEKIIDKMPDIIVSPSLILADINVYGYTYGISDTDIDISSKEIVVKTDIDINELESRSVPVPIYIANNKKKVVHKFDCDFVKDIDIQNRIGFFVMYEALHQKYKPCKSCLDAYRIV